MCVRAAVFLAPLQLQTAAKNDCAAATSMQQISCELFIESRGACVRGLPGLGGRAHSGWHTLIHRWNIWP